MSPVDLLRVRPPHDGHPRRGRGPRLHLQGPGGQHHPGRDDPRRPELRPQ